ncbi:NAD(P)H-binding protein [Gracilibacillus salitolerans]|uniref:NAD(P)H-binding protein n=1 Tax=Gracilibacillus salitolerans TaxID=2663022 RepID=A0A5Q2TRV4_9BACI|nr:NmrA family NAD(P)-binding protein [Gracilibacillus salitolerans]QGH35508.1 NAD(P)H-binding protein [Gracilibacillus salitolerans]
MYHKNILVAGATGTAGRAYVEVFSESGYRVKATVRPGKGKGRVFTNTKGVEPIEVDLRNKNAIEIAMRDTDILVVSILGRGENPAADEDTITRMLVDAAKRAKVEHIIYTSVYRANEKTNVPHFEVKGHLEKYIESSGIPYTILRPCTFMDALNADWIKESVLQKGVLASPTDLETPINYLFSKDLAQFALLSLSNSELIGKVFNLGGPEPITYKEIIRVMSDLLGRKITYHQIPINQVEEQFGFDMAEMIRYFNKNGFTFDMTLTKEKYSLTLTTINKFLKDCGWGTASTEKNSFSRREI